MDDLTPRQRDIFRFILQCHREDGCLPTVREIAARFRFASANAARDHLVALERKGYVQRRAGAARALEIAPDFLDAETPERGVPILGTVAAGRPLEALEHVEGYLDLDALYPRERHFALRIRGDSMVDAGMRDGDFAIVAAGDRVENGQIGVAVLEGMATVKHVRWLADGTVELVPANARYDIVRVDPAEREFSVAGRVVGLHRVF